MNITYGIVAQLDQSGYRLRCTLPEYDDMLSPWLDVLTEKAQGNLVYHLPDIGEQIGVAIDTRNNRGMVLGSIYSNHQKPPVDSVDKHCTRYSDGAIIEYDRKTHTLTVYTNGTINIKAESGDVIVDGVSLVNHTHNESLGTVTAPPNKNNS